ncbi:hypothetical protein B7R21_18055 [Subtercola boreus]|uniref:Uncharacterized protein n=1 Tax=Subtercola boreus TaxID=120213 RepID=A0A3E0VBF6_9MICO|nr:hypothetical protein B7R21_18055 [Subtercola boreus]
MPQRSRLSSGEVAKVGIDDDVKPGASSTECLKYLQQSFAVGKWFEDRENDLRTAEMIGDLY